MDFAIALVGGEKVPVGGAEMGFESTMADGQKVATDESSMGIAHTMVGGEVTVEQRHGAPTGSSLRQCTLAASMSSRASTWRPMVAPMPV